MQLFLPHYSEEEYKELLLSAQDRDSLCRTYSEWYEEVTRLKTYMESQNYQCTFVDIKVRDMLAFFNENGIVNNGTARSQYITMIGGKLDAADN